MISNPEIYALIQALKPDTETGFCVWWGLKTKPKGSSSLYGKVAPSYLRVWVLQLLIILCLYHVYA